MDNIEYIFQVTPFDADALLPQVSRALEKRMELRSRQATPGLWKQTDKLNQGKEQPTVEEKKRLRVRKMLLGALYLLAGVVILAPGFLVDNTLLKVVGAVAAVMGAWKLWFNWKQPVDRFDKAAKEFLDGQAESIAEGELQICFSDQEVIIVSGALEDLDQDAASYDEVELIAEAEDIFFLVYRGKGIILQKTDITLGTVEEFRQFASAQIKPVVSLSE